MNDRQAVADQLALDWANRHINKLTWMNILERYAIQAVIPDVAAVFDEDHLITKLLDLHVHGDCSCPDKTPGRDCENGYCKGCGSFWPCETIQIIDGKV